MKETLVEAIKTGMDNAVKTLHRGKQGSCAVDGCPHDALAKGFCNTHYLRSRKNQNMSKAVQAFAEVCIDCGEPLNNKSGWMRCAKHFKFARQKTIKEALVDAMGGCCQKCGGVFSLAVYDFHHVGDKDESPSYLIANSSVEKIAAEIEKCILLCANCHRIEHETQLG
jgi:hypothetical protein